MIGSLSFQLTGVLGGGSFKFGMYRVDPDASGAGPASVFYNVHVLYDPAANAVVTPALDSSLQAIKGQLAAPLTVTWPGALPVTVTQLPANAATAAGQAAAAAGLAQLHTDLAGTLTIAAPGGLPLPAGAATEARLAAIQAVLQAQADLSTSVWTDGTSYYVRRETMNAASGAIAVTFEAADGTPASVTAATLTPVAAGDALSLVEAYFDATATGTGYAAGDLLARLVVVNKSVAPPTASAAIWLNLSQGTTLAAAPAAGTVAEQTQHIAVTSSALPAGAATEATLAAGLGKGQKAAAASLSVVHASDGPFATYATQFGSQGDAVATSDAGAFSFVALFKRATGFLSTIASAVVAGIFQVATRSNAPRVSLSGSLAAVSASVTLTVDGMSTVSMQITGAWTGTIAVYGSMDGGGTYPYLIGLKPVGNGGPSATSFTANGGWKRSAAGYTHVQAQMIAFTSGSANVLLLAFNGVEETRVSAPASDPLPVLDSNNAAFTTATALPASGGTPGRSVGINCATQGNVVLTLSGGGSITLPIYVGWQTFPFAATGYSFSGGAAGAVFNLS